MLSVLLISLNISAQENFGKDSLEISVKPYGSFRGHYAIYDSEIEFQENASRIGFQMGIKKKDYEFFIGVELGMSLFKSNSQFNADGNTASGFIITLNEQASQVFNSRLGYLGFSFGKYGRISIGKQWSVYYDVSSYTDNFNVFGAQASSTFVAGTDGGSIGTGRADQSLIYRNEIGPLIIGLQLQAKNANNDNFIDGFGGSLQWQINEVLKAGAAVNFSYIDDFLIDDAGILGLDDDPNYFNAGMMYDNQKVLLSAVYSKHTNGDLTNGLDLFSVIEGIPPTVIFDAYGFEFFGRYKWDSFAVLAGYNHYIPDLDELERVNNELPVNEDFSTRDYILGMEYRPNRFSLVYAEYRLGNGENSIGIETTDVLTLGLRIDADHLFRKAVSLN
ncbi:porin [Pontixanthobacter gangjinensis]